MKIYLAGPMRGYPQFNHPAFHRGTALLRAAGHEVLSPAEHNERIGLDTSGMNGEPGEVDAAGFSMRDLLGADLAWITGEAGAVVVMPGWESSRGACAEVATALALGLPVWELAHLLLYGEDATQVRHLPGGAA